MNSNDMQFLNAYVALDTLCNDIFSVKNGVSAYIEEIERKGLCYRYDYDYNQLKHVRWLRNQLMHETYAESCSYEDIKFVENFRERIMQERDPLSEQRNRGRIPEKAPISFSVSESATVKKQDSDRKKDDLSDLYETMLKSEETSSEKKEPQPTAATQQPAERHTPKPEIYSPSSYSPQQKPGYSPPQTTQNSRKYEHDKEKNERKNRKIAAILVFIFAAAVIAAIILAGKTLL